MKKPHRKTWEPKGRPLKFTKEAFDDKVTSYLELRTQGGEKWPVTLLDFCIYAEIDKEYISIHNLKDKSKGDFSVSIKRLKARAERDLEYYMLIGKFNTTGAIFCLKNNFWWADKTEIDQSTKHSWEIRVIKPAKNDA